ncbi:MAG: hypothetical protein DMD99_25745 [Candidatus Rokuibacteriota bacterium]|nr:MAG: hypothetical protein DMD99_25745 [Candidatus Rokubacteria bacterium]
MPGCHAVIEGKDEAEVMTAAPEHLRHGRPPSDTASS